MRPLTAVQLKSMLDDSSVANPVLLDVRESWELETAAIPGVQHIPMANIPNQASELDPQAPTVVICHHGMRSMQVAQYLDSLGFLQVYNLDGGIDAWSRDVDPAVARY